MKAFGLRRIGTIVIVTGWVALAGCRSAKMQTAGVPPSKRGQTTTPASFEPPQGEVFSPPSGAPAPSVPADLAPPPPAPESSRPPIRPAPSVSVPAPAPAPVHQERDRVRISCVNGRYRPNHETELYVRPGDVVTLSADMFVAANGYQAADLSGEAFTWRSSLHRLDECSGAGTSDCLTHSNFQLTEYGVTYYVPYDMPARIKITVEGLDPRIRGQVDHLILRNSDYDGRPQAAPALITDPAQYPGASLDPNVALAGMGRWVTVEGVRYFTPYAYAAVAGAEWAPYRNGYWAWEENGGFTWISYDPWGWMTEHYGIWRHHATYGWLWLPFEDRRYQPHCVSWFHDGDHIGWYPYYDSYRVAYRHGATQGFDDGFWLGFKVGAGFGAKDYRYHPGFAIVPRAQFTNVNVMTVLINGGPVFSSTTITVVQNSFRANHVFPYPGGRDRLRARAFVEGFHVARPLPVTVAAPVIAAGGARIMMPKPVHPAPAEAHGFLQRLDPIKRPVAVGTAGRVRNGGAEVIAPTRNGRGLMMKPVVESGREKRLNLNEPIPPASIPNGVPSAPKRETVLAQPAKPDHVRSEGRRAERPKPQQPIKRRGSH